MSYVVYVELRAALADAREGSLAPLLRRLNGVLHTVATRCVEPRPVLLRLMGTFVVALDAALRGELDALAAAAAPEPELTAEDLPTLEASFADEGVEVDATALFESEPHRFVAKNALRPRTGSNQTQDRLASGGALVAGAAPLRALLRDASRRACYLLYRKARQ